MRKLLIPVFGFCLLFVALAAKMTTAEFVSVDFSAEMIMKSEGQIMQGKIYASGGGSKMRMEMAEQGQQMIMITRMDRQVSYMVMPGQNMYMEQPIDFRHVPKTTTQMPGEIERTQMGTDTVDGKVAKKFKVSYRENGKEESMYQWLEDGMPVPLKMEALNGSWSVEYHNVNVGGQEDSLFEPPAGYQKMAMPNIAGMLGQALGGGQDQN